MLATWRRRLMLAASRSMAPVMCPRGRRGDFLALGAAHHPWDVLANQPFDRGHRLVIGWGDDGDRCPSETGAAGAADPVNVVIGMMRHVEIDDVAYGGDVEPARRNVGGDQQ